MRTDSESEFALVVYQIVSSIPSGKVSGYGDIAKLAGHPKHSRFVGRLLANLPKDSQLPWWRVVKSNGDIALSGEGRQRQLQKLQHEGITPLNNRIPRRFFWPD